ncbi:tryptophan--tRNA ligase [Candidatus Sneabacter namystus]|uniref:Tryptophan--tRNA ligase n=1 Tax=Candidatus Sneabacter namystus TaxID=2601646 RepID=A0A5C0ULI3_9RICK|nr:tryptophan--tRNA ligase [Candidatus Sneabacter namystus]QEK39744.1 tryptophan--tRNA ligase [Candidatus Sneabacter namystus]
MRKVVLTGDRPTGRLHLGHYVGSLQNRIKLQNENQQYIMVADIQALTDNVERVGVVSKNIVEIVKDYLAVGLIPEQNCIFLQSCISAIAELSILFLNMVNISRLERNPTVKEEIKKKYRSGNVPAGFLCYPVSQAADILAFGSDIIPVGSDQLPMIEQTNEIARKFSRLYKKGVLKEVTPLLGTVSRLPGIDGKNKMGKSLNNAIYLSDSDDDICKKVLSMFTDPDHIKVSDPGKVDGNVVFAYMDVFFQNKEELESMKAHYKKGGLGDTVIKNILSKVLIDLISPMREKRETISDEYVLSLLSCGTSAARKVADNTLIEVKKAMGMFRL